MIPTTDDAFLGGRLQITQPAKGYRAGVDPVLLAAAVAARPGQSVLELGCGVGTALLCLMARVQGLDVAGVESDPEMVELARGNLERNGFMGEVFECDISTLPGSLKDRSFDYVIANPPFFDRARGSGADDPGREAGRGEAAPLGVWADVAIRRLKPGGILTFILRAERLPVFLAGMDGRVADIVALPLVARTGRPAKLVLASARKGAGGDFRLLSPFVLHVGGRHLKDGDSYSETASAILRDGAPLDMAGLIPS